MVVAHLEADEQSVASSFESASSDHGVGLSDPLLSDHRRRMLDLMTKLRDTGAQLDLDLPSIAVIGSQSTGKSSLIESISGISLPRASGTCTRCPTECRLIYSDEPWRCIVSLRFISDEYGTPLNDIRVEQFGDPIFTRTDVTDRIRRAQRAILNPNTSCFDFVDADDGELQENELTFSANYVCLEIRGRDLADLTFVDLPGLIATHGIGGRQSDVGLVESLAADHITKPSCIILLTVACETDFQNQKASSLAAQYDIEGARTIGVLTKPDRISPGEEPDWLKYIQGEENQLLQWFCVKNPNSQTLADGITWEGARLQEHEFFSRTNPWSNLEWTYQQRLGTDRLTQRLSGTLSELISQRLPKLQDEIDRLLAQTHNSIDHLPRPPSDQPVAEILHMIGSFVRAVEKHTEGIPRAGGLHQTLHPAQDAFQKAIRLTAPNFNPWERASAGMQSGQMPVASFLVNEEGDGVPVSVDENESIFVDDVVNRAKMAITRELPNNYPFIVTKDLICAVVKKWTAPSKRLFEETSKTLERHIMTLIEEHFAHFVHGGLKQRISGIVLAHLRALSEETFKRITLLLEAELEPFTRNQHYFSDYRSKFLGYYKGVRQASQSNDFIRNLDSPGSSSFQDALTRTLTGLTEMGLQNVSPAALARVLPQDPMEEGIEIMADVRAYFQVAYKRFVDMVPMTLDQGLIRGLVSGLENALFIGLGVSGPQGFENCRRLLQEPANIVERRAELKKKRDRLNSARRELMDVFTT